MSGMGVGGAPIGGFVIGVSAIGPLDIVPPLQTDIRIVWDVQHGIGDWQLSGADLLRGDDLATIVLVSLFTDRICQPDDVIPDGTENRRGWWGDDGETFPIGSRLWLLDRAKLTADIAKRAEDYCREALQWLIADEVVVRVDVSAVVVSTVPGRLVINIVLYKTDGQRRALNFVWVWKEA